MLKWKEVEDNVLIEDFKERQTWFIVLSGMLAGITLGALVFGIPQSTF